MQSPRHASPPTPAVSKEVEFAHLINRAGELRLQGRLQESMALFEQAERLKIQSELFYFNRGMLYYSMGMKEKMALDFSRALKLAPNHVDMLQKMAIPYIHLPEYPQAITLLNKAVKLNQSHADAWLWLSRAYYGYGDDKNAYEALRTGHQHCSDDAKLTIAYHLFLPQLPSAKSVMLRERARFMAGMATLMNSPLTIEEPEKNIQFLPNPAAYHGMNDKELRTQYAALMLKLCPSLAYTAPHVALPVDVSSRPIRIGIVAEELRTNATGQFLDNIFKVLKQQPEFELFLFTNSPPHQVDRHQLGKVVDHYVFIGENLEQARAIIASKQIDIMVYLEIGVRHLSYFLSFARLAKHQCAWVGFPVTTGVPNIDYFMLPRSDDTPSYKDHFTEAPLFFDQVVAAFDRISIANETKTRADYGLGEGEVKNYVCPVLLHKLHPDMDDLFARILAWDPNANIILFQSRQPKLQQALTARLHAAIPEADHARIRFIPFVSKTELVHVMMLADAVLDCVHFSFGTTAYLAFSGNVPFVAHRGEFLYRGLGTHMYDKMGLPEMSVGTFEEYVALAVRLANDPALRREMSRHIQEHADMIFGDNHISAQVAECFKALAAPDHLKNTA